MSFDDYAKPGTKRRRILDMHYQGMPPSRIDARLGLMPGEAHDIVVDYWDWDDAIHHNEIRDHNRRRDAEQTLG